MTPDCTEKVSYTRRGLGSSCYQIAMRLIKSKKTTWEDMEKRGVCAQRRLAKVTEWLLHGIKKKRPGNKRKMMKNGKPKIDSSS